MDNNEKQFEDFVSNIKFDDTPDTVHRDKLEQNLLTALGSLTPLRISSSSFPAVACRCINNLLLGLHPLAPANKYIKTTRGADSFL